jgi:hypothetical protein
VFTAAVKLRNGRTARDTAVYTFAVGDVDPNAAAPGGVADNRGGTAGNAGGESDLAGTGASGVLPLTTGGVLFLGLGAAVVAVGRKRRKAVDQ